jgi:anti-sigma B factor antagonist
MRAMSSQNFTISSISGSKSDVHVLAATGAITSSTSTVFQDAVSKVTARYLILDLSAVPSLDSMAVGALVRALVHCNKSGRRLALAGLNRRVQNVLELAGLGPLFEAYPTVAEAERNLS